jgi:hypothetical protein
MLFQRAHLGHGIGLRSKHYGRFLDERPDVGWIEAISENFIGVGGRPLAVLEKVRRDFPVVLHGVSRSAPSIRSIGSISPGCAPWPIGSSPRTSPTTSAGARTAAATCTT